MASSGNWQGMVQQGIQQQSKQGAGGGKSDRNSQFKKAASSAGKAVSDWAAIETSNAGKIGSSIQPVRYNRGGKIPAKSRKKNRAVLITAHENERVIPADKRKKVERLMKREGMSLTNKKRGKKRKNQRSSRG